MMCLKDMVSHTRKEEGAPLKIHNTLEVTDRKGKSNDIKKRLILRIRQVKQICGMFGGKLQHERQALISEV